MVTIYIAILTLTNQRSVHTLYFRVLSRFQNKIISL